jgi:carboxyl-terminal processing protease
VLKRDSQSGAPQIAGVLPNSPAAEAGLSSGLIICKIDDVLTVGMGIGQCAKLIRGPIGTKVRLQLVDPDQNETNTVELTRQRVPI